MSLQSQPLLRKWAEKKQSNRNFVFYIKIKLLDICDGSSDLTDIAGSQITWKVSKYKDRVKIDNKSN